ncbi:hypothetical protein HGA88_02820 [Candidatus Roizmanbacteria bacterium]|nr:hypothetical protein [Candidatus Roizmanbacteria bacterium]
MKHEYRTRMKKETTAQYTCPFCKQSINASSKTDIFYRKGWIKGCYNCFALSIDKENKDFQLKNY